MQLLIRAAASFTCGMGPFRCYSGIYHDHDNEGHLNGPMGGGFKSPAKHAGRSAAEAVGSKTVFLLDTSVNSQKKLASRLDKTTGRCLALERNQRFFKELTDVWCKMTTFLVRTRNGLLFL